MIAVAGMSGLHSTGENHADMNNAMLLYGFASAIFYMCLTRWFGLPPAFQRRSGTVHMRGRYQVRGPVTLLAVGLASSWSVPAALAACGMAAVGGGASGPPSISATETSTTQVLEQIRRRTQAAQDPQPIPVSNTSAAPVAAQSAPAPQPPAAASGTAAAAAPPPPPAASSTTAAASTAAPAPKPAAVASAPKPVVKKTAPVPQPVAKAAPAADVAVKQKAPVQSSTHSASLKDDYSVIEQTSIAGGISRTSAVWAQGYLGYDRHKNIAPGNQENPTRTQVSGGGLLGADWTHVKRTETVQAVQFGVFSGYNETRAKHTDTFFFTDEIGNDGVPDTNYFRTNYKEDIDGPFIGAYLAVVHDRWTFDATLKADFYDLTQSSSLQQRCGNDFGVQNGSASVDNYTIATNIAHRYDLSERHWWAPTIGLRYTYTDFGKDPSTSVFDSETTLGNAPQLPGRLGLEDGSTLRLQAGARLGDKVETERGHVWTTTVGAFLYSDVLINGFKSVSGQTGEPVGPVDEGKIRALGQLETRLDVGNGLSYLLQAEVRGGGDYFGAAGQIGIRYEW